MRINKLFFYNEWGYEEIKFNDSTMVISEIGLPVPEHIIGNTDVWELTDAYIKLRVGVTDDIVVGDQIVLRGVKRLDQRKNIPPHIDLGLLDANYEYNPDQFNQVFLWKSKRIWVQKGQSCLYSELLHSAEYS